MQKLFFFATLHSVSAVACVILQAKALIRKKVEECTGVNVQEKDVAISPKFLPQ